METDSAYFGYGNGMAVHEREENILCKYGKIPAPCNFEKLCNPADATVLGLNELSECVNLNVVKDNIWSDQARL